LHPHPGTGAPRRKRMSSLLRQPSMRVSLREGPTRAEARARSSSLSLSLSWLVRYMFWRPRAILYCMRPRVALALMIVCAVAAPGFALSINELDVNASLMVIGSTSSYGDVSPIVQLFGVSLPLKLSGPFFLEPMIEFFGTDYEWSPDATAVPAQIEAA